MNLYLITQNDHTGYGTYDSAVVAAESAGLAMMIHPSGKSWAESDRSNWADSFASVQVRVLGSALDDVQAGVILASYNDG